MNTTPSGSRKILHFSEDKVREELQWLSSRERNAFAWACARRCYSCYETWADSIGIGPDEKVFQLLEELEKAISKMPDQSRLPDFEGSEEATKELIPTEDSEWSPLLPLADHALASLAYAVRSAVSGDAQEAAWAARRAYEATDQEAINRKSGTSPTLPAERDSLEHVLVQQELVRQKRDLDNLRANSASAVLELAKIEAILDEPN